MKVLLEETQMKNLAKSDDDNTDTEVDDDDVVMRSDKEETPEKVRARPEACWPRV